MNTLLALAMVVIKELYRRKDFYVLFVLTAVITVITMFLKFFNDPAIVRHIKEICLLLIWISGLIIALTMTARQIPAERENRTIFPLLAKPVTRGQVIVGKFLGCWFAVGVSLAVFYLFLLVVSGSREGVWPVLGYLQAFLLQWAMLAVVIAVAMLGSVVFTSAAENVTISFFFIVGILWVGGHLNEVARRQAEWLAKITYAIYFIIPHLEWFDVRDLIVYNQPIIPWIDCALAVLYALTYVTFFLAAAWLVFRRKPLAT